MSRTIKEGKHARRRKGGKPESKEIGYAVSKRGTFGSTEKILRRNRKTWTRLGNKRRRALDKKETDADTGID